MAGNADAGRLFDARPHEVAAKGAALFTPEEVAQLFAIADQASEADRAAMREMGRA